VALKGVNLGGWLVAERWMTPSLFKKTNAQDEFSLNALGEIYKQRLIIHHETFIQETDFKWLKQQGVKAVRLPIGYWVFGDEPSLVGAAPQLDWVFSMAKKYDMLVFLSIHGAKGSQNGKKHSGKIGDATWHKDKNNIRTTLEFIEKLCKKYGTHPNLWGIELLNEPHIPTWALFRFLRFYQQACHIIRANSHDRTQIVISDALWPWKSFWAFWAKKLRVVLDVHYYHSFGINRHKLPQEIIAAATRSAKQLKKLSNLCPVIVGEWSLVMGDDKNHYTKYAKAQMQAYEQSEAWFYWSYKTELPGTWNFRDCVEKGFIKLI